MTVGTNQQNDNKNYHRDICYQASERHFANIFQRRINLVGKYSSKAGKVLEIGSSTGVMLSLFQKLGWEVLGIEVSRASASKSQEKGIATIVDYFEKVRLLNQSFDLVILNHTLEHLTSPIEVLQKVNRLLKENGLLLIDVPNFGSISSSIYKGNWPYLLPNEHLWHFTDKAFQKILPQVGFEIIKFSHPSGVWDYGNPWLELWQSLSTLKKRFLTDFFTLVPSLLVTLLGKGTALTVIARKK